MEHPAHQKARDNASRGDLLAEQVAALLGSWKFIIWQSIVIVGWILINSLMVFKVIQFDAPPYILLNLVFSTQAAYATPILLLANNRQSAIDKIRADTDHEHLTQNTRWTKAIHAAVVKGASTLSEIRDGGFGGPDVD